MWCFRVPFLIKGRAQSDRSEDAAGNGDIVPNWVIDVPDPNVTIGRVCSTFKVEMVIRGYLSAMPHAPMLRVAAYFVVWHSRKG